VIPIKKPHLVESMDQPVLSANRSVQRNRQLFRSLLNGELRQHDDGNKLAILNYIIENKPLPEAFSSEKREFLNGLKTLFSTFSHLDPLYTLMDQQQLQISLGHSGGGKRKTRHRSRKQKKTRRRVRR
jgi:hypothetical protein